MEPQHAPPLPVVEPGTRWIRCRSSQCWRRPDRSGREIGSRGGNLPRLSDPFALHLKPLPAPAADLPLGGRHVELRVVVGRFWFDAAACGRKIVAERFPSDVLPAFARRASRLEQIVHHLGLALGGRPGASLAQRLRLPVSRDTLSRVIRRRATTRSDPLCVIGIDDFAWRRNHRSGTLVCNLERRRIVALLPDREQATAQTWLQENTSIQIVARDGGGYGEAIARGLHEAFGLGVVVEIAAASHRADQFMLGQYLPVCGGGILRSAVGVMHAAIKRRARRQGGLRRGHDRACLERAAQGIADDLARLRAPNRTT
ncbi:hypothetical protein F8B43_3739 [Methylorubrum populi]|uniref:Transposase IS204/IS1001/IS1096/IS1165 DDE domain-containing protein n=1 Tax=Methylorubrum populi TaxID=223967 RepID=A0A833J585_9HYPH|nr:hypothetical protein F8B43_3739 [Methylorubrum populi]